MSDPVKVRLYANAGFVPQPGVQLSGDSAEVAKRLDQLAKKLGIRIFGISGNRPGGISPSTGEPVGSPNDPHAHDQAIDIGVGSLLRSSAGQLTDAQLASVGLYRPFSGDQEINHIQLKPDSGGGSLLDKVTGGVWDTLTHPFPSKKPHSPTDQAALGAANAAGDVASTAADVGGFLAKLTDPRSWIRVVEVVMGAVLVLMGLKSFTGGSIDPIGLARRAVP